ncbi:MAG: hypothetical protein ABH862_05045 [Candidatus Omnitrophota bacterium]
MAIQNKITPEEKLLHIIENTKHGKPNVPSGGTKSSPFGFIDISSILRVIKIDPKHLTLKDANKVLILLGIILTFFAFYYLAGEKDFIQNRLTALKGMEIKKDRLSIDLDSGNKLDAASYKAGTLKNNPFHLLPVDTDSTEKKAVVTIELNLVGILWSDMAQAIVEEPAANKTHMVYVGDFIENYKVEEITQTEVKLVSEHGEKILR